MPDETRSTSTVAPRDEDVAAIDQLRDTYAGGCIRATEGKRILESWSYKRK